MTTLTKYSVVVAQSEPQLFINFRGGSSDVSLVRGATSHFEQHLRNLWNRLCDEMNYKAYDLAKDTKNEMKKYWVAHFGLLGTFTPGMNHSYTRAIVFNYYLEKYKRHNMPRKITEAIEDALSSESSERQSLIELVDDDWIEELWDELGDKALAKVKIPKMTDADKEWMILDKHQWRCVLDQNHFEECLKIRAGVLLPGIDLQTRISIVRDRLSYWSYHEVHGFPPHAVGPALAHAIRTHPDVLDA